MSGTRGERGQSTPAPGHKEGEGRARAGALAENIAYFARALRAAGLPVGPGAVLDALAAVAAARIGTRADFYWTLHAVFVKRHEHSLLFDQAFRIFFRRRATLEQLLGQMLPAVAAPPEAPKPGAARVADAFDEARRSARGAAARRSSSPPASPRPTERC